MVLPASSRDPKSVSVRGGGVWLAFLVTVHGSCPLALFRGGQVPFSASSSLGKLAIIEPKKVPDPTPVNGYLFWRGNQQFSDTSEAEKNGADPLELPATRTTRERVPLELPPLFQEALPPSFGRGYTQ